MLVTLLLGIILGDEPKIPSRFEVIGKTKEQKVENDIIALLFLLMPSKEV